MFKASTENELIQILKIISEEAVKKSKKVLSENKDPAQERFMNQVSVSEKIYGANLSEQEDAEEDKEIDDSEELSDDTTEEDDNEEVTDPESFGVSFDSVIKDINTLRSGRSTKDKEIKDELLGYYDKLDDGERKILHLLILKSK